MGFFPRRCITQNPRVGYRTLSGRALFKYQQRCYNRNLSFSTPLREERRHTSSSLSSSSDAGQLVYPQPPTTNHHDLPTFLQHAERSGLDPKSTTFVGTHFEYTVANCLSRLGFSLRRIGGSSDYGIDLLGVWSVPSADRPLRTILQCKSAQRPGPHLIRELEGAFAGAPPDWRHPGVLGFLATDKPATKGIRDALGRSHWPMGFIACSRDGVLQQLLWNRRAEQEGLEGMGVGLRYLSDGGEKTLSLMWKGKHLVENSTDC